MAYILSAVLMLTASTVARANLLFASVEDWHVVTAAATAVTPEGALVEWEPNVTVAELESVFDSVWETLQDTCPSLPSVRISQHIDIGFDDALLAPGSKYDRVLGWAARTELLVEGKWQGVLATDNSLRWATAMGFSHFGTMRVARQPPGGWFRGDGGCENRFRLEDTILHELLHLLGVSSSVRQLENGDLAVGSPFQGECYPGVFDAAITDANGQRVVSAKCAFRGSVGEPLFVEGVELYTHRAGQFMAGASLSHLLSDKAFLTASQGACDPDGPRRLTSLDAKVMSSLKVACNADKVDEILTASTASFAREARLYTEENQPVSVSARSLSPSRFSWVCLAAAALGLLLAGETCADSYEV